MERAGNRLTNIRDDGSSALPESPAGSFRLGVGLGEVGASSEAAWSGGAPIGSTYYSSFSTTAVGGGKSKSGDSEITGG